MASNSSSRMRLPWVAGAILYLAWAAFAGMLFAGPVADYLIPTSAILSAVI